MKYIGIFLYYAAQTLGTEKKRFFGFGFRTDYKTEKHEKPKPKQKTRKKRNSKPKPKPKTDYFGFFDYFGNFTVMRFLFILIKI
jgi:hypothetical protein